MEFRSLDHVAEALGRAPVVQRETTLAQLYLTPDLLLSVDGQEYPATGGALSDVARVQVRLPGVSARQLRRGGQAVKALKALDDGLFYDGIVGKYDDVDLPDQAMEHRFLIAEVNRRLAERDRPVLVRWAGETVIAVLSPAYSALDHIEVVEALRHRGLNPLAWADVRRRRLSLAAYYLGPAVEVAGERYHVGLHLTNSETGDGRLVVSGYIGGGDHGGGMILEERSTRTLAARVHRGDRGHLMAALEEGIDSALALNAFAISVLQGLCQRVLSQRSWANLCREVGLVVGPAGVQMLEELRSLTGGTAAEADVIPAHQAFSALTALMRQYSGVRWRGLQYVAGRFLLRLVRRVGGDPA